MLLFKKKTFYLPGKTSENGTEAVTATYMKLKPEGRLDLPNPAEFYANRPFMFIVRLNGVNIFAGLLRNL